MITINFVITRHVYGGRRIDIYVKVNKISMQKYNHAGYFD